MIIKAESCYPISTDTSTDSRILRTKFWECAQFNYTLHHFDTEEEFLEFAQNPPTELEVLSRPSDGPKEIPINVIQAEFKPQLGDSFCRLIRGASIYVMNDSGKTIDVIKVEGAWPPGSKVMGRRPNKKRTVVAHSGTEEDLKCSHKKKASLAEHKQSSVKDSIPEIVVHDYEPFIMEKSDFTAQYDPACKDVALLLDNGPHKVYDRVVVNPKQYISVINSTLGTLEGHLEFERITRLVRDGTLKVIKDRHGSLHEVIENSGE